MNALTTDTRIEIQKEWMRQSLAFYTKKAWPVVDTETFTENWHIDAIAEHLEACAYGDIRRLLINVPPGTSKSLETCVMFPTWLWGPAGMPDRKFLSASFSLDNAKRDNRKSRKLIESAWYQRRWPLGWAKQEEKYIENTGMGFREATSVEGMTGKRGHFVVWDDPLNPEEANSDVKRVKANRIFSETMSNRLISPEKSVIIVIMQRLHQRDVSGYILEEDFGFEHLCLPMEFDPDRRCRTSIGFVDPRKNDGDLLHEERFPRHVVEEQRKVMGEYAYAGQNQQRPSPRGGGVFPRDKFEIIESRDEIPNDAVYLRGWDLAASQEVTSAWTAGVLMAYSPSAKTYYIVDVVRIQGLPDVVERTLVQTATADGRKVRGSIPQDPGSSGKVVAIRYVTLLAGYPYFYSPESGDKVTRADPFAAQVRAGNVKLVKGNWNRDYLDEIEVFPAGRFKDQVDASSRAFNQLATPAGSQGLRGSYG